MNGYLKLVNTAVFLYAGIQYFLQGNYWWGSLTILFTVLPKVFSIVVRALVPEMNEERRPNNEPAPAAAAQENDLPSNLEPGASAPVETKKEQ